MKLDFFRQLKVSNKYYSITIGTKYSRCDLVYDNYCSTAVFVRYVCMYVKYVYFYFRQLGP